MESHSIELAFLHCPTLFFLLLDVLQRSLLLSIAICSTELCHDDDTSSRSSSWSIHPWHYRKPVHSRIIRVYSSWTIGGVLHRNQDNPGSNHVVAPPSINHIILGLCSMSSPSPSPSRSYGHDEKMMTVLPGKGGHVEPELWHACAGAMVRLPQVGSKVIYFPQGHAEHAASPPDLIPPWIATHHSAVLCRIVSVEYLADTDTDEVYARMRLQPTEQQPSSPANEGSHHSGTEAREPIHPPLPEISGNKSGSAASASASFAKTLTQSDANNGGGFSVPRYCAETIFPRLNYTKDPPVQTVLAKDVHGTVWQFRHIYRGTPRRHLLTTGWSNFVNHKKLVAGDAIVFLKGASREVYVGVRRTTTTTTTTSAITRGGTTSSTHHHVLPPEEIGIQLHAEDPPSVQVGGRTHSSATNFTRNRPRVTTESVLDAAIAAAEGHVFEVLYYPRATMFEFCVREEAVAQALQQNWAPGLRFRMAVETEDASRISWFMGTICKVEEADPLRWPNSIWKRLQVTWDEPDLLQGIARVNPWQVELVSSGPPVGVTSSTSHYMHNMDHSHAMLPLPFILPKRKAARHDYNVQPYSSRSNADVDHGHQLDVSEGDGSKQQWQQGGLSMSSAASSHHILPANISISNRLKPDNDVPIRMRGARHPTTEVNSQSSSLLHTGYHEFSPYIPDDSHLILGKNVPVARPNPNSWQESFHCNKQASVQHPQPSCSLQPVDNKAWTANEEETDMNHANIAGTRSPHFYLFGTPISMGSSSQSVINTSSVSAKHKEEHQTEHSHEDTS